jgi:PAS domain S-box-containing protein
MTERAPRLNDLAPLDTPNTEAILGRLLFEEARALVFILRPDGTIADANPTATSVTGIWRENLRAKSISELCVPEDAGIIAAEVQLAAYEDRVFSARIIKGDGAVALHEVTVRCVDPNGERFLVCLMRDAGERRREERDRALAAIVTNSDDAIVGKQLDGTVTSWNPAAERLYGWSAHEMVGQSIKKIVPDDRLGELEEILARLRRGERIEHHETERITKDGRRIEVSLSVSPILDGKKRVVGAAKIARDVTERRRFERQQREFLLLAAHELRTPVTALQVSGQLMRRRGIYDEQLVESMLKRVGILNRLVDGLVDAARFEIGPLLRREPVNLVELAGEAVFATQNRTELHTVRLDAPDEPISGLWDRTRLEQVLENLLENALAYTSEGEILIAIQRYGESARISVADEGPGVPAELAPALFDRFVRLASPGLNTVPGLGLGLYLCRMLVEAHSGKIWFEPSPSGGAAFIVELPLTPAPG